MIERLIMKLDMRDPLHPEEREALAAAFQPPRRYAAGEDMVLQGSSPDRSTLLLEGLTGRVVTLRDGRQHIAALHAPGDFVDLHSFLLRRMDHSVTALTPCTVTNVPHVSLRTLTNRYPHLTRLLWLSTLLDAAIHRQWVVAAARLDAQAQLAHLACELYLRLDLVGLVSDHTFRLPLSQSQLAEVFGRPRTSINAALQSLRASGLLSWTPDCVRILDWDGLADFAEFDPTYLQLERMPV